MLLQNVVPIFVASWPHGVHLGSLNPEKYTFCEKMEIEILKYGTDLQLYLNSILKGLYFV